jgi:hypothetical protein
MTRASMLAGMVAFLLWPSDARGGAAAPAKAKETGDRSLRLLENLAGWAEGHWNEKDGSYNAAGTGVTWARGNGDVSIVHAVLLTELRNRPALTPRRVPREVLLDHVRRTLRTLCRTNRNCTDPVIRQDSVCVYQVEAPGRAPLDAREDARRVALGARTVERAEDGRLSATRSAGR